MERLVSNKTDVLLALLEGTEVEKWARVVMVQQEWGGKTGGISEWMVCHSGPLALNEAYET
jgi:hypothetical protein